jgi:signal transduction histidine kinase
VLLDREAVTGVIQNLLSNARKYSPAGTPIEVTVGEESRELFIAVHDQGPGIRRRDQKRIFRSFYRGENGVAQPGFGLGLAYCQQVARAHRGRMEVASSPGRGSTFTWAVPLDPVRAEGEDDG